MYLGPLDYTVFAPRSAYPPDTGFLAPAATLTAVYSGRDILSRTLDASATLGDLADMLPARNSRDGGTLTYVRIVLHAKGARTRRL